MLPGLEMIACPNLAVSPEVMQHIVHVESSANPYAIGVVGGQLVRQPSNLGEALATVRMLDSKGYNYSLGLSQVNRANFAHYGLDSYEKAFDRCANLVAGSRILADCYKSAGGDWGKAFSCYYSGNFTTGFHEGYVQKVLASIDSGANEPRIQPQQAIALKTDSPVQTHASDVVNSRTMQVFQANYAPGTAGYRVALRSLAIDKAASATVSAIADAISKRSPATTASPTDFADTNLNGAVGNESIIPGSAEESALLPASADSQIPMASATSANTESNQVFVPQVRGPNNPLPAPGSNQLTREAKPQPPESANTAATSTGAHDAAFVF